MVFYHNRKVTKAQTDRQIDTDTPTHTNHYRKRGHDFKMEQRGWYTGETGREAREGENYAVTL